MQDDENGTFELVIKIYFPTEEQPGGAFSNFIDTMPINECVDVRGPTGEICYTGKPEPPRLTRSDMLTS